MKRLILAIIGLVFLIIILSATGWLQIGATRQPIAFNHLKHAEQGLECLDCHKYVMEHRFAGLPNIETCSECHEEKITESKEEEKLVRFIQDDVLIPWSSIYRQPDHVYYSHAEHVGLAGLECQECHGNIAEMETPPRRPAVNLSMDFCMDCHRKRNASLDCLVCHI